MKKWEMVKLGDVCDFLSGYAFDSKLFNQEVMGMPLIRIRDVKRGFSETYTTESYEEKYIIECNDILIGMDGEFNLALWKSVKSLLNQRVCKVVPKNELSKQFVKYCLLTHLKKIEQETSFVTVKHLSIKKLQEIILPLPPLEQQRKIAKNLDLASELVTLYKSKLEQLDKLIQSVFYEMFGDPVTNEKGWEVEKLGKIAKVGSSKRVFVEELVQDGVPFYRGTEIGALATGEKIKPMYYITKEHYYRLCEHSGKPVIGDLLMPSICYDGRIWRVDTENEFYFKDGRVLWVHFPERENNDVYLQYFLREKIVSDYHNIASGTTFAELKIFALKDISVMLPPLPLQQKFAEIVTNIEEQKKEVNKAIVEAEMVYNSLMQEYFE